MQDFWHLLIHSFSLLGDQGAGSGKDRQVGEADDSHRGVQRALHRARHHRDRLLFLRAALPVTLGAQPRLPVRAGVRGARLLRLHAQVLYVSGGGHHVRVLDLEWQDH